MHKLYGISRRIYGSNGKEIIFTRGDGCHIYDQNDKEYVDMILGYGPIILGHNNREFSLRLMEVINNGYLFPSYGSVQIELAEQVASGYPNHQLISIYQSGSDGLDAVLRICKYITGKEKYIRFGYIGWHDNLLNGGVNWHEPINSNKFRDIAVNLKNIEDKAINWYGDGVDSFEELCRNPNIACFIFDAYQIDRWPMLEIEKLIAVCKKNNILVVLDETKTSGRVASYGFYKDKLDYDFTILGKAVGNGYPVSLLIGSKKFTDIPYDTIKIAGTYARDGLCCGAVLATEKIMEDNDFYEAISITGYKIAQMMNECILSILGTKDVTVMTMLQGGILEFSYSNKFANDFILRTEFSNALLNNGIIIPDGHCFYICSEHIVCLEELKERFYKALYQFSNSMVLC